jgi:hypothetical protein
LPFSKPNNRSIFRGPPILVCVWLSFATTLLVAQKLPPVVNNDVYVTGLNMTLVVNTANGLLINDTDPNGALGLTVGTTPASGPTSGVVTLNADGSFSYIPASGSNTSSSFEYLVCDDGTPDIVVSRFDFDAVPLTAATVGPDAIFIDADAEQTGCGIHIPLGRSGGSKGLDLVIPNTGNIFDFTSFRFDFEYRDKEGTADIATAGNFRVYHITANQLGLRVSVINGSTGLSANYTINLGNFLPGNTPYTLEYDELTGNVLYTANGTTTTTTTKIAPPYSRLDISLATDITIGRFMVMVGQHFQHYVPLHLPIPVYCVLQALLLLIWSPRLSLTEELPTG